jgi:hypothetical protein
MRVIMRTTGQRDLNEYRQVPGIKFLVDAGRDDFILFQRSLEEAGTDSCLIMEDDIVLCENFWERACAEIAQRPGDMISFFSMRKEDLTVGSRYVPGKRFLMMQCVYFPPWFCPGLLAWSRKWDRTGYISGTDCMVADFLGERKLSYFVVVPNLVDHKVAKSLIDPRRSSKRQSLTFAK